MKLLVVLCILAWSSPACFGQYIIRVHAFSQEIIPGVAPAAGDGEVPIQKKHYDYQVFIECRRSVEMKLNSIRLKEKLHSATLQIVESPVVQFHPTTMRTDTLIHGTPNKLLKVILTKELATSSRDTTGGSITYSVRGKKYCQRIRSFKELSPIAMP
jgi:hypothetical protein